MGGVCCFQYVCQFCCKIFQKRQNYMIHIRGVHNIGEPVRCGKCGKTGFTSNGMLANHRKKCTGSGGDQ